MKNISVVFIVFLFLVFLYSCENSEDVDKEKPEIDLSIEDAFPVNCDTLYFGEAFRLKVRFIDNVELGTNSAFSIDIHHNFDHHSHSTEVTECNLDEIKDPVNTYTYIEDYDIPEGLTEYETYLSISIPDGNDSGFYQEGDYHFFISLKDKEGWSSQKGLSIKILQR